MAGVAGGPPAPCQPTSIVAQSCLIEENIGNTPFLQVVQKIKNKHRLSQVCKFPDPKITGVVGVMAVWWCGCGFG
jgi:hypothetical protein